MADTNPPSTIRVTIGQQNPTVRSINYGQRTLKSASDLDMYGAVEGDVIVYKSETNSFVVEPISNINISLDNGFF